MSIDVMTHVWKHSQHKGSELLTLLAIADFAHDDGTNAYPAIASLAKKTRMTERNVQLVLKKLEASHELHIKRNAGPGGVHMFQVNMHLHTCSNPKDVCTVCGQRGSDVRKLERQHIIPTSWGGPDVPYNITPLCTKCHHIIHGHLADLRKELGSPSLPFTAQALFARMGEKFSPLEWVKSFRPPEKFSGEKSGREGVKNPVKTGANFSPNPSLRDPSEEEPLARARISHQGDASKNARLVVTTKPRPQKFVPDTFHVTAELRQWATAHVPGLNLDYETAKMRDHEYKTPRSDWVKAWHNWMRTAWERLPAHEQHVTSHQPRRHKVVL